MRVMGGAHGVRKATALGVGFGAAVALAACGSDKAGAKAPVCANNVLEALEGCDDGNLTDGDGCDSTCLPTGCGSEVYTTGELCYDDVTVVTIGTQPQGVALADLNRDGHLDAAVTSLGTAVAVYFGDGTGALTRQADLTAGAGFTGDIDAADFDHDSDLDLVVASSDTSNPGAVSVFVNDGSGTFAAPLVLGAAVFVRGFAIADFNGDTHLDIVTGAQNSDRLQRWLGDGKGAFTAGSDITLASPVGLRTGDLNGDGAPDLVVNQNGFSDFKVLLNKDDGSGDFADPVAVPLDGPVGDIAIHDFDGDGKLDLAVNVGSTPRAVTLWKGDGAGGFSAQSATLPVATNSTMLAVADLDGDGPAEVVQLEYSAAQYFVFAGRGGFTFDAAKTFPAEFPAEFAIGDLDEDGFADLALASQGGSLRVSLFHP